MFVLKRDRNTQVQKKSCKGKLNEKTNSYTGLKKIHTTDIILVSLACVNDETRNLQLIFRPGGGSPLYRLYRYVLRQRVCFFKLFWSEIGYQFRPFWSEIGYGLCTLVLNWVCFLEKATSSSFGDKAISLLMLKPTLYVS